MELNTIYNEDCLEGMKRIPDGSVDLICCDLPYGTTAYTWDKVIPMDKLWEEYNRVLTKSGTVLLFGTEPFSSRLRMSNFEMYKYDWIWRKSKPTGFQHAKNMPLRDYEIISVFSKGGMGHKSLLRDHRMTYNPQGVRDTNVVVTGALRKVGGVIGQRPSQKDTYVREQTGYPKMVLDFKSENSHSGITQKPVDLVEYLVRTYSNEGEVVLDNCMGSGTTAIACIRSGRNFIGFEIEEKHCEIANDRINLELQQLTLF